MSNKLFSVKAKELFSGKTQYFTVRAITQKEAMYKAKERLNSQDWSRVKYTVKRLRK